RHDGRANDRIPRERAEDEEQRQQEEQCGQPAAAHPRQWRAAYAIPLRERRSLDLDLADCTHTVRWPGGRWAVTVHRPPSAPKLTPGGDGLLRSLIRLLQQRGDGRVRVRQHSLDGRVERVV